MAARKKKKKARARRAAKKAPALNVVVGSKVKESVKSHGIRCSGDLVEALDESSGFGRDEPSGFQGFGVGEIDNLTGHKPGQRLGATAEVFGEPVYEGEIDGL